MRLSIRNLTKVYDDVTILNNISLEIEDINSLVVIGPSGGGKSTLIRILAGLEHPTSGEIYIDGEKIDFHEEYLHEYRKKIGLVFQAYNLFPHLTAMENITLPLEQVHKLTKEEAKVRASEQLIRFGLEEHMNKKPIKLSGGQQQRVAISRAIALHSKYLILDEPTSALDPALTAEILDMIKELINEGKEVILVTHSMSFASQIAKKILFISDGVIAEEGDVSILQSPKSEKLRNFLSKTLKY